MRMILDLDGTLLDSSQRHYESYLVIAKYFNIQPLLFPIYWNLRRARKSNLEVLFLSGLERYEESRAEEMWRHLIELPQMLTYDQLFPSIKDWLDEKHLVVDFILVTLRHNEDALRNQLKLLGISDFFLKVMAVSHQADAAYAKARAVQDAGIKDIKAWIGDTEIDIKAAEIIGTRGIGVTSGIRNSDTLREAGALEIYENVTQIDLL